MKELMLPPRYKRNNPMHARHRTPLEYRQAPYIQIDCDNFDILILFIYPFSARLLTKMNSLGNRMQNLLLEVI